MAGTRLVGAGENRFHHAETAGAVDSLGREAGPCPDRTVGLGGMLQRSSYRRADRDDAPPSLPGPADGPCRGWRNPVGFIERQNSIQFGVTC